MQVTLSVTFLPRSWDVFEQLEVEERRCWLQHLLQHVQYWDCEVARIPRGGKDVEELYAELGDSRRFGLLC